LGGYGVLIMSKLPIDQILFHPFPTNMGRRLLVAELTINGEKTQIATVHLESMSVGKPYRKRQLEIAFPLLKNDPDTKSSFLMGDFNFCSTWRSEQENLDPEFLDAWDVLKPNEFAATCDTNYPSSYLPARFDRVMVRSKCWVPANISLVGDKPISGDFHGKKVFPSDHLGVLVDFKWKPN